MRIQRTSQLITAGITLLSLLAIGWGIALVRRCADEIRYARAGAENVLCLTRRVGEVAGANSFR